MKITNPTGINHGRRNDGMAVIVMLALLTLVLAFIFANLRALSDLHGELKMIEQKQIHRLNHPATNTTPESAAMPATGSRTSK